MFNLTWLALPCPESYHRDVGAGVESERQSVHYFTISAESGIIKYPFQQTRAIAEQL